MILSINLLGESILKELKTPEEAFNFVCDAKGWVREIIAELGFKEQINGTLKTSFEIHIAWCNANDEYSAIFKIVSVRTTRWVDNKPIGKVETMYKLEEQTHDDLERCVQAAERYILKNGETDAK